MAGGGVGEAMLISAAMGGGTAAITGGDPLKGALLGAATGGIGHGIAGATAAGGANVGTQVATTGAEQMVAQTAADQAAQTAAMQGVTPDAIAGVTPVQNFTAQAASPDMIAGVSDLQATQNLAAYTPNPTEMTKLAQAAENPMFPKIAEMSKSGYFYPGLGAASGLIGAGPETNMPEEEKYSGSLGRFNYDPDRYRPYRAASGGLMDTEPARRMAAGGLGSYSDGGQMLKGPGDGMSDDIPASIGDEQPARLADGEFVVPADVVSGIGNGSTDAGAEALYAMLDRVRKARTGRTEQAPEIDAQRMMPA
jgi:hypothetical protein